MQVPAGSAHGFVLRAFLLELAIYGVLVVIYFFLVLHFLGDWLARLFHEQRTFYAVISVALIIGQAVLLQALTSGLLRFVRGRLER